MLNPKRLKPWQRHFEYAEQLKQDQNDYMAWLSGRYVLAAIAAAFSKNADYPEEPYSIIQRREEQADANRQAADSFMAFAMAWNARYEEKQTT